MPWFVILFNHYTATFDSINSLGNGLALMKPTIVYTGVQGDRNRNQNNTADSVCLMIAYRDQS